MRRTTQAERASLHRDFIWALLWGLRQPGWQHEGWVSSREVYEAWLDGRDGCGIVYAPDYVGSPQYFTRHLNWLCTESRAEVSRAPGRHPRYRAIEP